jgi:tRNA (guanine37-N1)-methyltransferase
MIIDILTLFPDMFQGFVNESIIKRAIDKGLVTINIHNFRDYSLYKNKQVDDYPIGGGGGMVLMCEPIFRAIEDLRKDDTLVVMLTPSGQVFSQQIARDLSCQKHLILLCGHYEGFDERIKTIVDMELSIGDYVLTGGELASQVVSDAIIRLIPGVISDKSLESESFDNNLLDYPNYTKPIDFRGMKVPDVLLSGHHANIDKYRYEEQLRLTKQNRSDLLEKRN